MKGLKIRVSVGFTLLLLMMLSSVSTVYAVVGTWLAMASTPADVGGGGSLAWAGGDYIYALRGYSTKDFWRYSISGNSWASMASTPANVFYGGSLAWAGGDYIYALEGGSSTLFWRYSISGNSWASMASTPSPVYRGGSLAWAGGYFIYAFDGWDAFWRYSITGNNWTPMASTPGIGDEGASLAWAGGDYIYALKGGAYTFWRYSISGNSWASMRSTPSMVESGGSLAWAGGDYIYALEGGFGLGFMTYSISWNRWTYMAWIPAWVYGGGSLAWAGGDYIYALGGGWSTEFWRFTPPPPYDVTIDAYCYTEAAAVSVSITMDGSPTGYNTPKTFTGLIGVHTFTVPSSDASGHPFKQWSTGETTTTIAVSSAGTYTAYYEAPPPPPPPQWSLTIDSNPISGVPVTVDGSTVGNTPTSVTLTEGTHTVAVPSSVGDYNFLRWEDSSTNPTRTINILADTTITAYYEAPPPPPPPAIPEFNLAIPIITSIATALYLAISKRHKK